MATFRKRSGKWQVQIRKDGCCLNKTFGLREDAQRWAREHEHLLDRGDALSRPNGPRGNKLTLGELLDRYTKEISSRKRSSTTEGFHLRALYGHRIAKLEAGAITVANVGEYRDHRLKRVSPSTVRRELVILQHAFRVARNEWAIDVPDLRDLAKPTEASARNRRLTEDDLKSLSDAFRACRNPLVRPVFLFALATGMRRGEVLSLRWKHIDLEGNTAFLPMTKNGSPRTVPLSRSAISALPERQQATKGEDLVFPISANALRLSWERLKRRAGITDLRFHDLRHEAISRFFELGLSVPEVSLISGHKDPRMLFRYTHLRATDVARKLHRLDE